MKSSKTILQILLLLMVVFIAAKADAFAKKPFIIKLVEKPAVLHIGQSHTFAFDVRNVSGAPLTLSSQCATSANLSWLNRDGTSGGTGSSCGTTGYSEADFFTLQPNETKRLEATAVVPRNLKPRFVTVTISYESQYDGRAIGLRAWTGAASSISLKMRVVKYATANNSMDVRAKQRPS